MHPDHPRRDPLPVGRKEDKGVNSIITITITITTNLMGKVLLWMTSRKAECLENYNERITRLGSLKFRLKLDLNIKFIPECNPEYLQVLPIRVLTMGSQCGPSVSASSRLSLSSFFLAVTETSGFFCGLLRPCPHDTPHTTHHTPHTPDVKRQHSALCSVPVHHALRNSHHAGTPRTMPCTIPRTLRA